VQAGPHAWLLRENAAIVANLGTIGHLTVSTEITPRPSDCLTVLAGQVEVFLPLAGLIDSEAERQRLEIALAEARAAHERLATLLENVAFIARARPDVIERERSRFAENASRIEKLTAQIAALR
jgi:valyl-tRNA synthetase